MCSTLTNTHTCSTLTHTVCLIAYVLRCSTLDGWTSVDSSKLKKACINKCRMRMSQRRRLGQMTFFNPEHYMMGPSDLQQSTDGF